MENEDLAELLPVVFRFALRLSGDCHLAEDITQETMLRAFNRRKQSVEIRQLRPWLLKITLNLYRDHCRRSGYVEQHDLASIQQATLESCAPSEQLQHREQVDRAMKAMESLPPRQRNVLHLVACEQLSIGEAAVVLGITSGAVKSTLSVARRRLRQQIRDTAPTSRNVSEDATT